MKISRIFIECSCLVLFLLAVAKSDHNKDTFEIDYFDNEEDDYDEADDEDSSPKTNEESKTCNCIPIRRCKSLSNRIDLETAGETCFGYGEFRGVCCPETSANNDEECGQNVYEIKPSALTKVVNAPEGSWPWMAVIRRLSRSGTYETFCIGFLISRRHVVSAAHCYNSDRGNSDLFKAIIGHVNQDVADEYKITRIAIHADYTAGKYYNDIAILTLDREVDFPNFNPVCLPDEQITKLDLTEEWVVISGWGRTYTGPVLPNLKYWTGYRVVPNEECQEIFSKNLRRNFDSQFPTGISEEFLCAGFLEPSQGQNQGVCPLSGSPLMLKKGDKWIVVGCLSFGLSHGRAGIPDVFTNIANYADWIKENTID